MHTLCHLPALLNFFFKVTAMMLLDLENQRSVTVVVLLVFQYLSRAFQKHTFGEFSSFLFCDWAAMATFLVSQRLWLLGCVSLLQRLVPSSSVTLGLHYGLCYLPNIYI